MGSRAKWEDMVNNVQDSLRTVLSTSKDEVKPENANLGSGMAEKAKSDIKGYAERQRKAMKDAGVE